MCHRAEQSRADFNLVTTKCSDNTGHLGKSLSPGKLGYENFRSAVRTPPPEWALLSNPRRTKGNLQLAELLAELPGICADPADGILAQMKLPQGQQAVEPAFGDLCEVVMV